MSPAHVILAAFAAVAASIPIACGALVAARPFTLASARYRVLACGFALSAAVGPLALLASWLRPAAPASGPDPLGATLISAGAVPALAALAAVSAMLLTALGIDVVKLRRVKHRAAKLGRLAVRGATLGTSRTVAMPTAIGYLHPAVIVPADFRGRVDPGEWDAVVAHECAHLARRDDWAKAAQSATARLGWWIPGLWLLSRALDLERELASDERAARQTGAPRYAACLLRLATERIVAHPATGFGGRRSHVAIRVERLLRPSPVRSRAVRAAALGAFTALVFGVLGAAVVVLPGAGPRAVAPVRFAAGHPAVHRARVPAPRIAQRVRHPIVRPRARIQLAWTAVAAPRAARVAPAAAAHPPAERRRTGVAPRPAAAPLEVAVVFRHVRCGTCFGPLRSPDDAVTPIVSPPSGGSGVAPAVTVVAPDDLTAGPVTLGSDEVWFRLPARSVSGPQ